MDLTKIRQDKIIEWKKKFGKIYPDSFNKEHKTTDIESSNDFEKNFKTAGKISLKRVIGKIAFFHLKDFYGSIQIALKFDELKDFDFFCKNLDLGDIIGIEGNLFLTKTQEKTLNVKKLELLSKCIHPMPEKFKGLVDDEQKQRQRYLDLLNPETANRFKLRSNIMSSIKDFFDKNEFVEVETPILQKQASGAIAKPFITHHNALDMPLFLRIAPETYLKRLMTGGYERVYEMGKSFRNEGIDSSHLQEFTMCEAYAAFWNYKDLIKFVKNIFTYVFEKINISPKIKYENHEIDFSNWSEITYTNLVKKYTSLDLDVLIHDESKLIEAMSEFIDPKEYNSLGSMIDALYKKHCRPNLIQPTIVTKQPAILGPLARKNDENPFFSDRFQIVVATQEIVNAYSELINPEIQRQTLQEQARLADKGEEEAMAMEEDFLLAMEYAMPPMAGFGIGIDRIVALITNSSTLKDVVFFPNIK